MILVNNKGGNVAKLAASYADKLFEIKAAKAAKMKEESSKESWGFTPIYVFSYLSLLNYTNYLEFKVE